MDCLRGADYGQLPVTFNIVSGAATNFDNKKTLEDALPGRVTFQATVIPDQAVTEVLEGYLREELRVDKVAVLTESNTSYGKGFSQKLNSRKAPYQKSNLVEEPKDVPFTWVVLPFPMHISQVRSAYEKDRLKKAGRAEGIEDIPRLTLELPLDETGNPRDTLPPFAPPMTAASDERVLDNILSSISREGIQYVGLLATNLRDKLFLAQQIRKYCPDVRLFTFGSDILFTHPDERPYLEGMIVASTYPLFTKNQHWTFPFQGEEKHLQFPVNEAEGVYNATLALLGQTDKLFEYATPFKTGFPLGKRKPPIWLSIVGRGDLLPLKFFSSYDDQGYVYTAPDYLFKDDQGYVYTASDYGFKVAASDYDERPADSYSWVQGAVPEEEERHFKFWLFVFVLINLFCLVQAAGYFFVVAYWPRDERLPNWVQLFDVFRPRYSLDDQPQQCLYALVCFLTLLIVYTLLAALFFIPAPVDWWAWLMGSLVVASFLLLLSATVDIASRPLRFRWKNGGRKYVRWLQAKAQPASRGNAHVSTTVLPEQREGQTQTESWSQGSFQLLLLVVIGVVVVSFLLVIVMRLGLLWGVHRLLSPNETQLFYERAMSLASGLSPVVPVMALGAGGYLWSLCHLRRLRLLEGLAMPSPFADHGRTSGVGLAAAGVCALEDQVRKALWSPVPSVLSVCVVLVLSGLLAAVLYPEFTPTFEGRYCTWGFEGALFLLYLGVVLAFLQFLTLWSHFRRWLRRFALHPMVDAYNRVPLRISQTLGGHLWARLPTLGDLELSVQHGLLLANHFNCLTTDVRWELWSKLNPPADRWVQLTAMMLKMPAVEDVFAREVCLELEDVGTSKMAGSTPREMGGAVARSTTWKRLSDVAQALVGTLELFWEKRPLQGAVLHDDAMKDKPEKITMETYTRTCIEPVYVWLRLAEDFVALQMVTLISQVFAHLRNLLIFVTTGVLVLLLAITSYPFQPQRLLMVFLWIVILSVVTAALGVFVQIERSEVLSRIAKTEPNKVSFNRTFLASVVAYGVLPLVGLLVTQFPAMGASLRGSSQRCEP